MTKPAELIVQTCSFNDLPVQSPVLNGHGEALCGRTLWPLLTAVHVSAWKHISVGSPSTSFDALERERV